MAQQGEQLKVLRSNFAFNLRLLEARDAELTSLDAKLPAEEAKVSKLQHAVSSLQTALASAEAGGHFRPQWHIAHSGTIQVTMTFMLLASVCPVVITYNLCCPWACTEAREESQKAEQQAMQWQEEHRGMSEAMSRAQQRCRQLEHELQQCATNDARSAQVSLHARQQRSQI